MTTVRHGINGLIYVAATELGESNSWRLTITSDLAEGEIFGGTFRQRDKGVNDWSGNITGYLQTDSKVIETAALASTASVILLYPNRSDLTDYYTGSAFFGANIDVSSRALETRAGDFVGAGTLTQTGFS